MEAALDLAVPVPTISSALFARFASRQDQAPAMKMITAMRNQFGGHTVRDVAAGPEHVEAAPGEEPAHPAEQ